MPTRGKLVKSWYIYVSKINSQVLTCIRKHKPISSRDDQQRPHDTLPFRNIRMTHTKHTCPAGETTGTSRGTTSISWSTPIPNLTALSLRPPVYHKASLPILLRRVDSTKRVGQNLSFKMLLPNIQVHKWRGVFMQRIKVSNRWGRGRLGSRSAPKGMGSEARRQFNCMYGLVQNMRDRNTLTFCLYIPEEFH